MRAGWRRDEPGKERAPSRTVSVCDGISLRRRASFLDIRRRAFGAPQWRAFGALSGLAPGGARVLTPAKAKLLRRRNSCEDITPAKEELL